MKRENQLLFHIHLLFAIFQRFPSTPVTFSRQPAVTSQNPVSRAAMDSRNGVTQQQFAGNQERTNRKCCQKYLRISFGV